MILFCFAPPPSCPPPSLHFLLSHMVSSKKIYPCRERRSLFGIAWRVFVCVWVFCVFFCLCVCLICWRIFACVLDQTSPITFPFAFSLSLSLVEETISNCLEHWFVFTFLFHFFLSLSLSSFFFIFSSSLSLFIFLFPFFFILTFSLSLPHFIFSFFSFEITPGVDLLVILRHC